MAVWSEDKTGDDGLVYSVRYLLAREELIGMQQAGIIGPVAEIVGMQDVADSMLAGFEKQAFMACGGVVQ